MSIERETAELELRTVGLDALRSSWGWYLALGIVLVALGAVALGAVMWMTMVSVLFVGWLLIGGGVLETIHAFCHKKWGGFFIDLFTGILYVVVGFMVVANPEATAVTLTLLIAMFLIFGGIFRIIASVAVRCPHWGWVLLHGVISILLGVAIWRQWPLSGLFVIGLFVGIEMIFNGWSLMMLGLVARRLPKQPVAKAAPGH